LIKVCFRNVSPPDIAMIWSSVKSTVGTTPPMDDISSLRMIRSVEFPLKSWSSTYRITGVGPMTLYGGKTLPVTRESAWSHLLVRRTEVSCVRLRFLPPKEFINDQTRTSYERSVKYFAHSTKASIKFAYDSI